MPRSSVAARIITAVIGAVIAPIAYLLLAYGGSIMMMMANTRGGLFESLVHYPERFVPALLALLASFVLTVAVVGTGVWSSAGLLAAGVVGIPPVLLTIFPAPLFELTSFLAREHIDAAFYGVPVFYYPVLGAMGIALLLIRRSRPPRGAMRVITGVAAPILLLVGGWMLLRGATLGFRQYAMYFDLTVNLGALALVVFGMLFVAAGIVATRWAWWALLAPAGALLLLVLIVIVPIWTMSPPLLPVSLFNDVYAQVVFGSSFAVVLAYLAFSVVVRVIRTRQRRAGTDAAHDAAAYPIGAAAPAFSSAPPPNPYTGAYAPPVAPPYAGAPATPPAPPAAPAAPPAPPAPPANPYAGPFTPPGGN